MEALSIIDQAERPIGAPHSKRSGVLTRRRISSTPEPDRDCRGARRCLSQPLSGIGSEIFNRQKEEGRGWLLPTGLRKTCVPRGVAGGTNCATACCKIAVGPQCPLPDLVKARGQSQGYIEQTILNGWSRNVLVMRIQSDLNQRFALTRIGLMLNRRGSGRVPFRIQ